mgnify:CR=1 FL=1
MGLLTGLLYACLAVFAAGWYFNKWSGNFSLLLFILTVVTFAYWLAERFYFAPRRLAAVADRSSSRTPRGASSSRARASPGSTTTSPRRARRCSCSPGGSTGPRACSR